MLIKPIITEKTVAETKSSRFTFKVDLGSDKTAIKKTVEQLFGVKVVGLQTITMPGKAYRTGKKWKYAYKADWKKAIVTLVAGQTIDLFDVRPAEEPSKPETVIGDGEKVISVEKPKRIKKGQK